ncbi:MFS transporter [Novosphingobium guangzhouense]|uniref:Glucarate transporter n=1 Tax=Novosphingobium guangzhouense TaxID=1850347 RepID=A0A2K2FZT7_9SPHN|nr:MFS transporter [Novosphingobium guangzhouense]PNU04319.1 glucarate transporter [Novosphingobium guangzhouense]
MDLSGSIEAAAPAQLRPTRVRYCIIALIFIITSLNYADRSTFSIAGASASAELGLDAVQTGFILSAFAWAYSLAQIPGGALLDRFGTRPIYIAAIGTWSFFTVLQGFAGFILGATVVTQLFLLRFLVGLCEAPSFPGNARIVAAWFPARERGTASAIFNSAQYFSLVAFAPLMGWVVHEWGWRAVFFVMGGLGLMAMGAFAAFIREPVRHKWANRAEIDLIREGGGLVEPVSRTEAREPTFTWNNIRQLLTSRMMIGVYLGQYCINVLTYFFVTWFPIYLVKDRGFNILEAGFVAALPALCGFVGGVAGGVMSDMLLARTGSITTARKAPLLAGMLLASLIMVAARVESQVGVVLLMSLAFFGKGVASLGWAVMSDVAPRKLAGLAGGVFNTFGNAAGIVTPIVVGILVAQAGSFDTALIFVGAHCLLTIVAYFVVVQKLERLELAA